MVEYKIYRNENRDIYYLIRKMSHEIFIILTIVCCSLVFCVVKKCGGGKRKRKRERGENGGSGSLGVVTKCTLRITPCHLVGVFLYIDHHHSV